MRAQTSESARLYRGRIVDELETWASEGYDGETFRLELGEMTQEALDGLPEFDGW